MSSKKSKPKCPVCRSKRWHRDALSGSIVCEEGHLLSGYVQESTETQEASQYTTTTRAIRKNRVKRQRPPLNDFFHGDRATFLLWQSLQLLLRSQLRTLIDDLGFPDELEVVCRDLWALLMASSGFSATPKDHAVGNEDPASYSGPRVGAGFKHQRRKRRKVDENGVELDTSEESSDAGIKSDEDSVERVRRDDVDLSRDDELASQAGTGTLNLKPIKSREAGVRTADEPVVPKLYQTSRHTRRRRREFDNRRSLDPRARPRLDFLLMIIYLGCVTLRFPVMLKDIIDLAETHQVPYLAAKSKLPISMTEHMSVNVGELLQGASVPRVGQEGTARSIQQRLARLVRMYLDDWDVQFPEPNLPLISWRLHRRLACSPLIYLLTSRLLALLPPPLLLSTPIFSARKIEQRKSRRIDQDHIAPVEIVCPEITLVAGIVVAAKMAYDRDIVIDGHQTEDGADLGLPILGDWLNVLDQLHVLQDPTNPSRLWSKDVSLMDNVEIDSYLNFCEAHLAPPHLVPKSISDLDSHFPHPNSSSFFPSFSARKLNHPNPISSTDQLYKLIGTSTADFLHGEHYKSYTSVLSLPSHLSRLIGHAAGVVGLTSSELLTHVVKIEGRLAKQVEKDEAREKKEQLRAFSKLAGDQLGDGWAVEQKRRSDLKSRSDTASTGTKPRGRPRLQGANVVKRVVKRQAGVLSKEFVNTDDDESD